MLLSFPKDFVLKKNTHKVKKILKTVFIYIYSGNYVVEA